ncbi:MAG: alkaline phosphatase PafA [Bacteroidota bacterium]
MNKHFVLFIATVFSASALAAQEKPLPPKTASAPKLVVGIVVDQMRVDYIYKYWSKYGNEGFKRLLNEGFNCKNTHYNYVPTYTGPGHASIYTGTTPAYHGIVSNEWYDREKNKTVYCAQDDNISAVGGSAKAGSMSPKNMLSTTFCDQLKLSNNQQSKVIGIALKDRGAILPAGHSANAAYWFDASTGDWMSSTFYMKELPKWVNDFNGKQVAENYISKPWTTLLPIEQYTESYADDNIYETVLKGETKPVFPHDLPKIAPMNGGAGIIRWTPFGNSLTKDFALEAIKAENLGKGKGTDIIAISFSSPDYIGHAYGPQSVEIEDTYLRLDKDMAEILKFIDTWVGKNNALVFLTADHAAVDNPAYLNSLKIPGGYFSDKQPLDSLKKHMLAKYSDSLILKYDNQQIYLDHKAIENKKLNRAEVESTVADFMLRFRGVATVVTASSLKNTYYASGMNQLIQNGFYPKRSGDVAICFEPGWVEYGNTGTTHGSGYTYDTHVPLLFYGWNIKPGSSAQRVHITDIAPTICMMLNIGLPNACTGEPIQALVK